MKKTAWPCYTGTALIFAAIFFWGFSGVSGGGGLTYRFFCFYAIIPATTAILGLWLGLKNARGRWLYPVLTGIAAHLMYHVLFRHTFTILPRDAYFLVPFAHALFGLALGGLIAGMDAGFRRRMKGVVRVVLILVFLVVLIHAVHALTLDRIIEYRELSFSSPTLSPALDGYRIAFIADTHFISEARLQGVVEELNRRDLDLVLFGGDSSGFISVLQRTVEALAQIEARDGIFGVEGNHDNYRLLFAAMEAHGITPLSNSGYTIRENLHLAGVEDLWNRNPDISKATENAAPGDFVLLLSHNPDVSMRQDTSGVDLILSGHTHGGQITFFGLWAPYFTFSSSITDYGQRFRAGWALSRDDTPVFVSRGTGEYLPRVFARPQVVLITLHSEQR